MTGPKVMMYGVGIKRPSRRLQCRGFTTGPKMIVGVNGRINACRDIPPMDRCIKMINDIDSRGDLSTDVIR